MRGWRRLLLAIGAWPLAGGFSPPQPILSYDPGILDSAPERAAPPPVPVRPPAGRAGKPNFRLTVDLAAIADSNTTNGTRLRDVPVLVGDTTIPVRSIPACGRGAASAAAHR